MTVLIQNVLLCKNWLFVLQKYFLLPEITLHLACNIFPTTVATIHLNFLIGESLDACLLQQKKKMRSAGIPKSEVGLLQIKREFSDKLKLWKSEEYASNCKVRSSATPSEFLLLFKTL